MTNYNKINMEQKNLLGEFMKNHTDLAKNLLPNCAQGKATAIRLWEELSLKLNAVGPPVKDAKMWRKVYADQKYQAKKKLSFNKASKRRTGGGPYEEKIITEAEENIIEAGGLEVAVEGLQVKAFGAADIVENYCPGDTSVAEHFPSVDSDPENEQPVVKKQRKTAAADPKLVLLEQNLKLANESKKNIEAKLDCLIDIQERQLKIKEEKFKCFLEKHKIEMEIKQHELAVIRMEDELNYN